VAPLLNSTGDLELVRALFAAGLKTVAPTVISGRSLRSPNLGVGRQTNQPGRSPIDASRTIRPRPSAYLHSTTQAARRQSHTIRSASHASEQRQLQVR
jgi:hypothetical protein